MPTIDDFSYPKEWVPQIVLNISEALREWEEEEYMPVRDKIDEDWEEHEIAVDLLEDLQVDYGMSKNVWPAEYGGMDMSDIGIPSAVMLSELGRIDPGLALSSGCVLWPMLQIALEPHRNQELIEEFAPKFCGDELYVGSLAMCEPQGCSDIEYMEGEYGHGKTIETTAELDGDEWVINGTKLWPTNGGIADLYGVLCTTDPEKREEGIAFIYVPADTEGVEVSSPLWKTGAAADANAAIIFDDVRVPKKYRAHGPNLDAKYFKEQISFANITLAAVSLGAMKGVYQTVKEWVSEREVSGKPLKEHSINSEALSKIATAIEVVSTNLFHAAHMIDSDEYPEPWSDEVLGKTRVTSFYATDKAVEVTNRGLELMGSYGYSRKGGIEKLWRDVKILQLVMGSRQVDMNWISGYFFECENF